LCQAALKLEFETTLPPYRTNPKISKKSSPWQGQTTTNPFHQHTNPGHSIQHSNAPKRTAKSFFF